jgi:hypothetical protein
MATKTVSLKVLADHIKDADKANIYAFKAIDELATKLDETFFKSSKIEKRGDFRVMCDLERY